MGTPIHAASHGPFHWHSMHAYNIWVCIHCGLSRLFSQWAYRHVPRRTRLSIFRYSVRLHVRIYTFTHVFKHVYWNDIHQHISSDMCDDIHLHNLRKSKDMCKCISRRVFNTFLETFVMDYIYTWHLSLDTHSVYTCVYIHVHMSLSMCTEMIYINTFPQTFVMIYIYTSLHMSKDMCKCISRRVFMYVKTCVKMR